MFVKERGEKKTIDTFEKQEVKFFRVSVGRAFGLPVEQLCLIYAGHMLKDHETLDGLEIKEGKVVTLVRRDGPVK